MTNKKNNHPLLKFCGSIVLLLTISGILLAVGGQLEFLGNERKQMTQTASAPQSGKEAMQKPKYSFYDDLKKRKTELEHTQTNNTANQPSTGDSPDNNYQYVIQVGAFSKKADAQKVMKKVNSLGYVVRIVQSRSKFLVQTGPYQGINKAKKIEKRLRTQKMDTLIKRLK